MIFTGQPSRPQKSLTWFHKSWIIFVGLTVIISFLAGVLAFLDSPSFRGWVRELVPFDIDTKCHQQAEAGERLLCAAFRRCDEEAGYPLDPERLEKGWKRGASIIALKSHLGAAEDACRRVLLQSPNSLRAAYALARVRYAEGRRQEGDGLVDQIAAKGYRMGLFLHAIRDISRRETASVGRGELEQLAKLRHPPPDALLTLAEAKACGIGGPVELPEARRVSDRALDEVNQYVWAPDSIAEFSVRRDQIVAWTNQDKEAVCHGYSWPQ
jgi:predicted small lipoprotein YifL